MGKEDRTNERLAKPKRPRRSLPTLWSWLVLISTVVGFAVDLVTLVTLLGVFSNLPKIYLSALLITLTLAIVLFIGVSLYKWQLKRRHLIVAKLRDREQELFKSIDTQTLLLLKPEVEER